MAAVTRHTHLNVEYPGAVMAETRTEEASKELPEATAKRLVNEGRGAFAFRYTSHGGSRDLKSEIERDGKRYLIGTEFTLEDIHREIPNSDMLVSNMKGNNWDTVIRGPAGHFHPVTEGDVVIPLALLARKVR